MGEYGNGIIRDVAARDLTAINNSPVLSYRNEGLDFNKTVFTKRTK